MQLKRLKSGGALANAINSIIDYLPRLAVQSTPEINATQTPRGQFVELKKRQSTSGAPEYLHAFKVSLRDVNEQKRVFVRWGTINGNPAFLDYPEKKIDSIPALSGNERVVLSVTGDFQTFSSPGVYNVDITVESADTPLEAEEEADSITWKIVLAYIVTTPAEGETPEATTVEQVARGHIFIGRGSPLFT
jgi:hypothetical protein